MNIKLIPAIALISQISLAMVAAQPTPRSARLDSLRKASVAESKRDFKSAIKAYDEISISSVSKERQLDARFRAAKVAERWAAELQIRGRRAEGDPKADDLLQKAKGNYQEIVSNGTGAQKLTARNNLGVIYLKMNKPDLAVQEFRRIDFNQVDKRKRFIFQSNYARALEKNKDFDRALDQYAQAIKLRPDYDRAVQRAIGLLIRKPASDADANRKFTQSVRLCRTLVNGGNSSVLEHSQGLLRHWQKRADAPQLLGEVARYYAFVGLTPDGFRKRQLPFLASLKDASAELRNGVRELQRVFLDQDLQPSFRAASVADQFPVWSTAQLREPLSRLLKSTGDDFLRNENATQAFARYSMSWTTDPTNTDAANYCAAILHRQPQLVVKLDRKAETRRFVDSMYSNRDGKKYKVAYESSEDWQNLVRTHVLLGKTYSQLKQVGNVDDRYSAAFHYQQAIDAHARVAKPDRIPVPLLHYSLAITLRTANHQQAFQNFIAAGEGYVRFKNKKGANSSLIAAAKLDIVLKPAQQRQLELLRQRVDELGD